MKKLVKRSAVALAACATLTVVPAYADQGDVLVRVRLLGIQPTVSTTNTLAKLNVGVNKTLTPEFDLTYMLTEHIGSELILGTARHKVSSSLGSLGKISHLPPALTLQWHFNPKGKIRPYAGAGVNYTLFYKNDLAVNGQRVYVDKHSFGPALQVGVDAQVADNVFVNADLKKLFIKTNASMGGTPLGSLKINPWILGVGVGMKF